MDFVYKVIKKLGARNRGIEMATGEYIMFLDSDDCLCPTAKLACLEKAILKEITAVIFATASCIEPKIIM